MTPLTQLLVFPGFDELDVVAPLEILRSAGFDLRLVTADGAEAVEGTHRVTLRADGQLDLSLGGLVIVPGGGWVRQEGGVRLALAAGVIPPLLAQARAAGLLLGSICTGAVLLGAAGLVKGRRVATHAAAVDALAGYGADVRRDVRVVDDGDLITCGGVTAAIDLGLHLVDRFAGSAAAEQCATRLEYAWDATVVAAA